MPDSTPPKSPSIWVLSAPGAGDQRQLMTLADALGGARRVVQEIDAVGPVIGDRLFGASKRPFMGPKAERYVPPWPNLVLIAGGRSVVDARRIREASGGRTRIVAIGRPWAAMGPLDLIVTTPQYRLPTADNVVEIPLPLNAPPGVSEQAHKRLADALPESATTIGVLLGGDSGSFRFGARAVDRISEQLGRLADSSGAHLVVCASPRTPDGALDALGHRLGKQVTRFPWSSEVVNPYPAVLADCDAFAVTGDSASMAAEACLTGKPVALLPLNPRGRSIAARAIGGMIPETARTALTRRGLWLPARDLPRLHSAAESRGWLRPLDRLLDGPVEHPPTLESLLAPVRSRIENLLRD